MSIPLLENTTPPAGVRPAERARRYRYALLAAGTVAMLFAVGGRWDIPLAAWIFPVLLLRFTRTTGPWTGTAWAWAAHLAAAAFWVQESAMGSGPVILAGAAALSAVQTVPFLLDRLLAAGLGRWTGTLAFPAAVAATEFLITVLSPFGTAYGSLAVTQHGDLPLLQVTSITGSYGIGFLIAWLAAAANGFWQDPSRRTARPAAVCAAVLAAVALAGGARLALLPHDGRTVRIAGVSPARTVADAGHAALGRIPGGRQGIAAAPPSAVDPATTAVQDDLLAATRREAAAGAKIVVWPENAVPVQAAREPAVIAAARAEARRSRVYLDIGIAVYDTTGPAFGRDETVLLGPDGAVLWTYQKAHPIPGSETYKPGDGRVPVVSTPYGRIANVICYDADFPAMMRARADIMLVPAHDWREYGRPHTDKAGLRAVEGGYALVRQDAQGLSAAFDARGHVLATSDYFGSARQTLVADVPVHGATTPYDRIGDLFAWLCVAAIPLLTALAVARSRRR
ncbi:nitrilase-related carbon-nitrogen hydrolase [Actinomadura verrucosospora]|uniref:Nitrilase/cyanide hydratase and apolipoprotein N-acyltransferase n=1 Tax=Actinomadura verrucosospora TaxID=46165 RepID=A0A7D3VUK3_ACTVE|nr:nitrilase-related carbon-nitrogen hydrolase [Actinomadura verrucosospora]QKG23299.1 nitrilase/cyanide hydratase and apolipoprotein N-acyltransferase [Actinomadura verrucosospora]